MAQRMLPILAVIGIFRNEAPYVLEWLAHHRIMGFSRFYIADNMSDDGTSELLAALERLEFLKCVPFQTPEGHPPQFLAYEKLLSEYARDDELVAIIDADEFVMPVGDCRDARAALEPLFANPQIGAVALNWACYGSSWRLNRTSGFVMERFMRRSLQGFGPNHHYKTILRRVAFDRLLDNPHQIGLKSGYRYVRMDGNDVVAHGKLGRGLSNDVLWDRLRVNHYLVKSRQEFEENKRPKGRSSVVGGTKGERYFLGHDKNDVRDAPPEWLLSAVRKEVAAIRGALAAIGFELPPESSEPPLFGRPFPDFKVHVDSIDESDGMTVVKGWAMHWSGLPPVSLALEVGGRRHLFLGYEHKRRADLVRAFPMACDYCGFELVAPLDAGQSAHVKVFAGYGAETPFGPFTFGKTSRS